MVEATTTATAKRKRANEMKSNPERCLRCLLVIYLLSLGSMSFVHFLFAPRLCDFMISFLSDFYEIGKTFLSGRRSEENSTKLREKITRLFGFERKRKDWKKLLNEGMIMLMEVKRKVRGFTRIRRIPRQKGNNWFFIVFSPKNEWTTSVKRKSRIDSSRERTTPSEKGFFTISWFPTEYKS